MRILAIETSCDETAIALVEASGGLKNPRFKIIKNLVASQIKIHRPFGGIVPTLAKREHQRNLPLLWQRIMNNELRIKNKNKNKKPIILAVTVGPGLEPALWTGIAFAKRMRAELHKQKSEITQKKKLKLIGVSHLDGHLYSFLLSQKKVNSKFQISNFKNLFPAIALIVSGGHTILLLMKDLTHYKKLGETRDDAVGEAFDKVARLLELPYPGGPEIERLAKKGNSSAINFPRPMINQKNYDFSFSGLKTAVLYYLKNRDAELRELKRGTTKKIPREPADAADIAASFQKAVFDVLIHKTLRAAKEYKAKSIMISGGVASNKTLQKEFKKEIKKYIHNSLFIVPNSTFCTDNAAMIAVAGYLNYLRSKNRKLVANGNLSI